MNNLLNNIDIIIYDYDFFLSIKQSIIIDNSSNNYTNKIKDKINSLFSYDYRQLYTQKVVAYYNNYNCKNLKDKEKNFKRKTKDKKIEIFLLLNKITESNYKRILFELKQILQQDKSILINSIDDLWVFCYKQSFYSILYVDLLDKLIIYINNQDIKDKIIENLLKHINKFIKDEIYVTTTKENENKNYEDFCDNNIKYKNIRGKFITICWIFLRTQLNIINKTDIIEILKNLDLSNDISLDLLHIYNTLINFDENYISYLKKYIETNTITKKNKYKIMDIIEKRNYQLDGFKKLDI